MINITTKVYLNTVTKCSLKLLISRIDICLEFDWNVSNDNKRNDKRVRAIFYILWFF